MEKLNDFIERLTNYKTTVIGIATAVIAIAILLGFSEPEDKEGLETGVTNLWDGIGNVLAAISGIVLILSKDSDKKV